jgi:hypothetical protein
LPTAAPTATPTADPTGVPTVQPTSAPTGSPTASPTARPSAIPTETPSAAPTATQTAPIVSSAVHSESTILMAITMVAAVVFVGLAIVRWKRSQRSMHRTAPMTSRNSKKLEKEIIIRRVFGKDIISRRSDGFTRPRPSIDWLWKLSR